MAHTTDPSLKYPPSITDEHDEAATALNSRMPAVIST